MGVPGHLKAFAITEGDKAVWKNNSYIDGVAGVANAHRDADWVTFDVGSGTYRFSLTLDGNVIKSSSVTPTVKEENVG